MLVKIAIVTICFFPKMGDPKVTIGVNTKVI